jgi:hypothetical protein
VRSLWWILSICFFYGLQTDSEQGAVPHCDATEFEATIMVDLKGKNNKAARWIGIQRMDFV